MAGGRGIVFFCNSFERLKACVCTAGVDATTNPDQSSIDVVVNLVKFRGQNGVGV